MTLASVLIICETTPLARKRSTRCLRSAQWATRSVADRRSTVRDVRGNERPERVYSCHQWGSNRSAYNRANFSRERVAQASIDCVRNPGITKSSSLMVTWPKSWRPNLLVPCALDEAMEGRNDSSGRFFGDFSTKPFGSSVLPRFRANLRMTGRCVKVALLAADDEVSTRSLPDSRYS